MQKKISQRRKAKMNHKVIINNWKSGWNEVLNGHKEKYNPRTKKMLVYNNEKATNDKLCRMAINRFIKAKSINTPIKVIYNIYAKDKKHDRGNLYAIDKSFLDALQETHKIPNDTWDLVLDSEFHTFIDKGNPRVEITIIEADMED